MEGLQNLPVLSPSCPVQVLVTWWHKGPIHQLGREGWPSLGRWEQGDCSRKGPLTGEVVKEGNPHLGLEVLEVLLGSGRLGKWWWSLESPQG